MSYADLHKLLVTRVRCDLASSVYIEYSFEQLGWRTREFGGTLKRCSVYLDECSL
jgi:hypothetical protein